MRKADLWRRRIGMGVLVALIGMLGVADFLSHTDDGCAVEVHCIACRAHLGPITDLTAPAVVFGGANHVVGALGAEVHEAHDGPSNLLPPGRAPPVFA